MGIRVFAILSLFFVHLFGHDYYSIDEYIKLHPQEKTKMQTFNSLVKNPPVPLKTKQKRPIHITIIYPAGELSDYWRRSKLSLEKRLNLLGVDYTLTSYFIAASNIQEHNKRIKEAFISKPDYFIFTLNLNNHKKIISQILSKQKPKIIIQNIATPLKEWEGNQPFFYVGFDHIEGTKLLAQYYKKRFPSGANYAVLYFKQGYISHMRADSFIAMMPQSFKLKGAFYTDGKASKSYEATKTLLKKYPNLDFIYASSTDVCIGAIKGLEEFDKDPIINGWGGGSYELELLKKRKLDVTVMRINDDNGIAMAEAIKLDLEKKYDSLPQVYSGNFVLIDQNSSKEEISKFSKNAFRYSGLQ